MNAANEIYKHIGVVRELIGKFNLELIKRQVEHDASKLGPEELPMFEETTPKLKGSTYGSEEYQGLLDELKPALDHHYSENRHHPEHFMCGYTSMNLIDIVEMFCDWMAATKRHADGNIFKSIEINRKRFGLSDDIAQIFKNTVEVLK